MKPKIALDNTHAQEGDTVMYPVLGDTKMLGFGEVARVCLDTIVVRIDPDHPTIVTDVPRGDARVVLSAKEREGKC